MSVIAIAARNRIWILLIAAAVDLAVGDPPGLWHPVRGIGALISRTESVLRGLFNISWDNKRASSNSRDKNGRDKNSRNNRDNNKKPSVFTRELRERIAGMVLVVLAIAASTGLAVLLFFVCYRIHPWLGIMAEGILCGRLLALRSLKEAAFAVRDPLLRGDVEAARRAVSMIVGRDTEPLDAEGIARAAVETVAENTSDGVTAPLFYMILFGGVGGIFYKAVNTMDSMIGYKNDRYRRFGTAAAKLDDLMNYIPSRLTALLMIVACAVPFRGISASQSAQDCAQDKLQNKTENGSPGWETDFLHSADENPPRLPDMRSAFRIWRRDHAKSPSPNSAQTESVCAGALHLRLLGDTWYFGKLHRKEEIGDGGRTIEAADITRAVCLMERTSFLLFAAGLPVLLLWFFHVR